MEPPDLGVLLTLQPSSAKRERVNARARAKYASMCPEKKARLLENHRRAYAKKKRGCVVQPASSESFSVQGYATDVVDSQPIGDDSPAAQQSTYGGAHYAAMPIYKKLLCVEDHVIGGSKRKETCGEATTSSRLVAPAVVLDKHRLGFSVVGGLSPADLGTRRRSLGRRQKIWRSTSNTLNNWATEPWVLPDEPDYGYCGAKRFYRETPGFCCDSGRIAFELPKMPPALWELYTGHDST